MTRTTIHPPNLLVGDRIRFNRPDNSHGPALQVNEGQIAAKTLEAVLIQIGVTLAGTKVLLLVPNDRITGVWLNTHATPTRTLVPVHSNSLDSCQAGGLLSRIFRDTPAPVVAWDGAYSLDDHSTPWAS
jgi:hypothetical protein